MRVVYFGTPSFAVKPLKMLLDTGRDVVGVVCQPDKAGNRNKIVPCEVKKFATENGLQIFQFEKSGVECADLLKKLSADVAVTCAYGQILGNEVLSATPFGVINVHASLLPKFRGASPIQSVILAGEKETGISIMKTVSRMDAGDVLLRAKIEIGNNESYGELSDRLSELGALSLDRALRMLEDGTAVFEPQAESEATFCKKITKETEKIDFSMPAERIFNLIRGLCPTPGAFAMLGDDRLKIFVSERTDFQADGVAGSVVQQNCRIFVRAGDGRWLSLKEIQPQNGKRMDVKSFCNGRNLNGCVLK